MVVHLVAAWRSKERADNVAPVYYSRLFELQNKVCDSIMAEATAGAETGRRRCERRPTARDLLPRRHLTFN
jgi:hypothetical protein